MGLAGIVVTGLRYRVGGGYYKRTVKTEVPYQETRDIYRDHYLCLTSRIMDQLTDLKAIQRFPIQR